MDSVPTRSGRVVFPVTVIKVILFFATLLVVTVWWLNTPPGLLGKADAVGYAVCHRIADRSFLIGDRQTPLCARCSGMYLGALLGIAYIWRIGRYGGMPPLKISLVFGAFLVFFALDGSNSYLQFFPGAPGLYEPQNWLRLLTGTGIGLGIAAFLVPVVHQTLWTTYDSRPALKGWREFWPLLGLALLVDLAVWSEIPLLLYPLALLSALGLLIVLSLVYAIVWILITKQENRFENDRAVWMPVLAGFLTAMVQIAVIDAGRYWFTGTWGGFNL